MPDPFPFIAYPGVNVPLECTGSQSWGISPARFTLTVIASPSELANVQGTGTLLLGDGSTVAAFDDCQVVDATFYNGGRVDLILEDYRWRWEFGALFGRYNVPAEQTLTVPLVPLPNQPPGNPPQPPPPPPKGEEPIEPWSRKTAPELAKLCLKAMGETRYDVTALDPNATPSVDWDAVNPAQALQQLASDFGCVVTRRPDTRTVVIAKQGDGQPLPAGGVALTDSPSLKARPRPDKIVCYGAPIRYQMRFALEPVGIDFDRSIRPLAKLSYAPKNGDWTGIYPPFFKNLPDAPNLPGKRTRWDAEALAQHCIYRYYRIRIDVGTAPGGVYVPVGTKDKQNKVQRLEQIHLLPFKNQVTQDDLKRKSTAPAMCYGRHTPPHKCVGTNDIRQLYGDTTAQTEVRVGFHVDSARQLIVFDQHVYARKTDSKIYPAEIVLECACLFAEADTMAWRRFRRELKLQGGLQTQPAVIVRDDIQYTETAVYADNNIFSKTEKNETESNKRADYYLRGKARDYELSAAESKQWGGVIGVYPDGACQQVSWRVGPSGLDTTASLNTEHASYLPNYAERRQNEEVDLEQLRRDKQGLDRARREHFGWGVDPFDPLGLGRGRPGGF